MAETLIHRCKVTVARVITRPAVGRAVARIGGERIRSHGLWIDVSDPVITPTAKAQLFWNLYEGAEVRFVRQFLIGHRHVVDLGGSIGIAALHALDVMDPLGRLVTVEAHPDLAWALRRRFRHNARVQVVEAAIAYGTDQAEFAVGESPTSSRLSDPGDLQVITVDATTLAEVVCAAEFDRFALISDIEGAELAMLEQDADILKRCDLAVFELHEVVSAGRRVTVEDLRVQLAKLGFEILAERGPVAVFAR